MNGISPSDAPTWSSLIITKPMRDEPLLFSLERFEKKAAMSQQSKDHVESLEQKLEACKLELRHAREELTRNRRLATLGEGVTGMAHYIKNILTGLRGGIYMVNAGMAKDKPSMFEDGWDMVQRNVENVSHLVLDILRYSKERTPERTVCSPNEIVSEAVELFRERAKEHHVDLNMVLDPNLKKAYLDRGGIHNVLVNLISNAIDACIYDTDTSKVWEVNIRTKLSTDADSSETILFEVADNGVGMTDEVKAKLFTRFFSTKAGRGTGLGLLGSQKIIHEHGGEITAESKAGQGATFSVRLGRAMPKDDTRAHHRAQNNTGT